MKLLLDENLSYRIVKELAQLVDQCMHVDDIGSKTRLQDIEIWQYAKSNDFTILTRDSDFEKLHSQFGFPPKVILILAHNPTNDDVVRYFKNNLDRIQQFNSDNVSGIVEFS